MKLLILNSKSFKYKLHHRTPVAEEVDESSMENSHSDSRGREWIANKIIEKLKF